MAKKRFNVPVVIYVQDAAEALRRAAGDKDARAMTGGPGTLSFHRLIAEHGAGEFERLYCPLSLKNSWRPPAGTIFCEQLDHFSVS